MRSLLLYISLSAGILVLSIPGYAQVHIGAKVGATFPKISYTQPDGQKISRSKTSIQAGAFLSIPLAKQFELRPAAELTSGYGVINFDQAMFSIIEDLTYLDIPVYLLFTPRTKKGKILLGAGPAMKNMLNGDPLDYYKSVDWAVNAMAGYEVTIGFSLSISFQKSLTDMNTDGSTSSRHYFGITAGYLF